MDRWTRLGIEAYRTGNREQAQRFFHYALMEKPNDIRTWLWLVEVVDSDAEKQSCLTRVLALDPNHVLARRALEDVEKRLAAKRAAPDGPFTKEGEPAREPAQRDPAAEIRSTPPFIAELVRQEPAPVSPRQGEARAGEHHLPPQLVLALILVALIAALLLAAWFLHWI